MQLLHPYFNIFYTMKRIFFLILFPVFLSQTAFGSFFIQTRQVITRLPHHLYYLVEAHTMFSVREVRESICIQCTRCGKSITFDTRNLN